MKFDPLKTLKNLKAVYGIQRYTDMDKEQFIDLGAVGQCGTAMLKESIKCFLVGLDNDGYNLIQKAQNWIEFSIKNNEIPQNDYFNGGTESLRYESLSLCNWIMNHKNDLSNLKLAIDYEEIYLNATEYDRVELEIFMTLCIQAAQYSKAIDAFKNSKEFILPTTNISKIKNVAMMAFVLCQYLNKKQYDKEKIDGVINNFLKFNIPYWLDHGWVIMASHWLKIFYWKEGDNPIETLLKCYSFLPDIQFPH